MNKTQKHKTYHEKNKEKRNQQRLKLYYDKKKQEQLSAQKHYQANSIKVLLSLKEYTKLNSTKRKLWCDFIWTIQDCQKTGFFWYNSNSEIRTIIGQSYSRLLPNCQE